VILGQRRRLGRTAPQPRHRRVQQPTHRTTLTSLREGACRWHHDPCSYHKARRGMSSMVPPTE
jgi:hypothetical protein